MNNSKRLFTGLVLSVLSFPGTGLHAQTKEETKDFLLEKATIKFTDIPFPNDSPKYRVDYTQSLKLEKDLLVVTKSGRHYNGKYKTSESICTVYLKDLNPKRVTVDSSQVVFHTTENQKRVRSIDKYDGKTSTDYHTDLFGIMFENERMAKRAANAFAHLITICGGKGDRFDD
jgi:hypothetical protein